MSADLNAKLQIELRNFKKLESVEQLDFANTTATKNIYRDQTSFVMDMQANGLSLGFDCIQLESLHSDGYTYDPEDEYLDTNICFHLTETNASKNQTYQDKSKGSKRNTYILCGICDPFDALRKAKSGNKNCTMNGTTFQIDVTSPIHNFHNTLGSGYVNHMADHHGLRRGGVKAKSPLLGFCNYKKDDFALCVICPYKHNDNKPCLSSFKFNYTGEHGFKGYLRHVKACHWGDLKKGSRSGIDKSAKDVKYTPLSTIIPLDPFDFERVVGESGLKHYFRATEDDLATLQIGSVEFGSPKELRDIITCDYVPMALPSEAPQEVYIDTGVNTEVQVNSIDMDTLISDLEGMVNEVTNAVSALHQVDFSSINVSESVAIEPFAEPVEYAPAALIPAALIPAVEEPLGSESNERSMTLEEYNDLFFVDDFGMGGALEMDDDASNFVRSLQMNC